MNCGVTKERWRDQWDQWKDFTHELVTHNGSRRAKWTQVKQIIAVIDRAGRELGGVHSAFLPGGGIVEITSACRSLERPCVQLDCRDSGHRLVCLPMSLMCFSFPDAPELNYFDLRLRQLAPWEEETARRRERREEWYGYVRTADGTERRDEYTRLLRGRMMMFATGAHDEYLDGRFERFSRKELYRFMRREAVFRLESF
jgi:hypothetical protein